MRWSWLVVWSACWTPPVPPVTPTHRTSAVVQIDAKGVFTFEAPPPVRELRRRGIDSLVGAYDVVGCTLRFDFGEYSNELTPWALVWPRDYQSRVGRIGNAPARWARWTEEGTHNVALHVHSGLTIFATCPSADLVPGAMRVLETVVLRRPVPQRHGAPLPLGTRAWTTPEPHCAATQHPSRGAAIVVRVVDEDGRPVERAFVFNYERPGITELDELTDKRGVVVFRGVVPATYDVGVSVSLTPREGDMVIEHVTSTATGAMCRDVEIAKNTTTRIEVRARRF